MGILTHFSPIFLPFFSTTFHNSTTLHDLHPVCYVPSPPPLPPFSSIFLPFPPFSLFPPPFSPCPAFFRTPKSWFGELVSSVAVSADAFSESVLQRSATDHRTVTSHTVMPQGLPELTKMGRLSGPDLTKIGGLSAPKMAKIGVSAVPMA